MKDIAVRDLRPGMTVYIGSMRAKVSSANRAEPPTMIAGGRKSAMAIKLELVVIAHPAETVSFEP